MGMMKAAVFVAPGRIVLDRTIALLRPRSRTDAEIIALYEAIWESLQ